MRHLAQVVVVGLAICSGSTALAAEHLMHISEVLVSNNNDTGVRYVELADPGLEPFPNTYKLVVYNAAGTMTETVTIGTIAANTQRMLIGTAAADTAFTTTRDATLAMPLPTDGQVCFERADINSKIHCLAWGCVTTLITGASRGATPPSGMSVQRQSNAMYALGTPTPDATNQVATPSPACPTETDGPPTGPDAGVTIDAALPDNGGGDAGNNNNNGGGDDSGCCQVDGSRGAAGAFLLAIGVLVALRRRRR